MSDGEDDVETARRAALAALLAAEDFHPPSSRVVAEIAARSRQGTARATNDDHYLVVRLGRDQETIATSLSGADMPAPFAEHGYAMLVADGLGEGGSGSVASRVALSTLAHLALHHGKWNLRIDPRTAWEIIERAEWFYARVDDAVFSKRAGSTFTATMSTTLTAAYSAGDALFIANVGHSRAYLFRDGALVQLTRDQTIAQHLADTRRPASVEGRARDLSHILTDAIGAGAGTPTVEVEQFRLINGDIVLLCTNGLTDAVSVDGIADVLASGRHPDELCESLTDLARQHGGEDNVTVVLAQYRVPPA